MSKVTYAAVRVDIKILVHEVKRERVTFEVDGHRYTLRAGDGANIDLEVSMDPTEVLIQPT